MPKLRLFWAINLPPALKAKLAGVQEKLKTTGAGVKWVKKENLHLTLQFLGDVEESEVVRLVDNMRQGFLENFLFCLLSLLVACIQLNGHLVCLLRVRAEQKFYDDRGVSHSSRSV